MRQKELQIHWVSVLFLFTSAPHHRPQSRWYPSFSPRTELLSLLPHLLGAEKWLSSLVFPLHPPIKLASWTGLLPLSTQAVPTFLSLLRPSPQTSTSSTECGLFPPCTLWLLSGFGILAEEGWGVAGWRASELGPQIPIISRWVFLHLHLPPPCPPLPVFLFQKNLSLGSFLSLQCWGRQGGGFWMGEQGGPYLTSGLKHSFRKGKGRRGWGEKPFKVLCEIKATLYFHGLGFGWRLCLQWSCRQTMKWSLCIFNHPG